MSLDPESYLGPNFANAFATHGGLALIVGLEASSSETSRNRALRSRALVCLTLIAAAIVFGAVTAVPRHTVRATGAVRAVNSITVMVPRIEGQGGNVTLATLAENGATVKIGDSLATFDRANELKLLRDAETKFDDLEH